MFDPESVDFGKWLCERSTYSVEAILRRNLLSDPLLFEDVRKTLMRSANSGATSCQYSLVKVLYPVTGSADIHNVTLETFYDEAAFENLKTFLQSKDVFGTSLIQIDRSGSHVESESEQRSNLEIILSWSLAESEQVAKKTLQAKKSKPAHFAAAKEMPMASLRKNNFAASFDVDPKKKDDADDTTISYF